MTQTAASTPKPVAAPPVRVAGRSRAPYALRRLWANKVAFGSFVFLLLLFLSAVAAPLVAPYEPTAMRPLRAMSPPTLENLMGTDELGRDIFSRVIFGSRLSLQVAIVSVLISALIGVPLGLIAGYAGRWIDDLIMRFTDVLLAFPGILLALAIVNALRPGIQSVIIAVGISGIPHFVRMARGTTLTVKENQYVEAAHVAGCSDLRILVRHILPNILAPIIVLVTLGMGTAILTGAALSFLGLGAQPPTPEWGTMMNAGRDFLRQSPWITSAPGLVITVTVLAINLLGDGLRDALDPRPTGA